LQPATLYLSESDTDPDQRGLSRALRLRHQRAMHVAICMPVVRDPKALFTLALADLIAWSLSQRILRDGEEVKLLIRNHLAAGCSRIEHAREMLAESALAGGADYLLWLDDDHVFPPETLLRLIAHNLPMVGCNYPKRRESAPSASTEAGPLQPRADGLEPVGVLPLGVCLTAASVFAALPRPWFQAGPLGEDGHFSQAAITHGIQPHVDHGLSMHVGHIAETVLRFEAAPSKPRLDKGDGFS
jgi:hypothetical protein